MEYPLSFYPIFRIEYLQFLLNSIFIQLHSCGHSELLNMQYKILLPYFNNLTGSILKRTCSNKHLFIYIKCNSQGLTLLYKCLNRFYFRLSDPGRCTIVINDFNNAVYIQEIPKFIFGDKYKYITGK